MSEQEYQAIRDQLTAASRKIDAQPNLSTRAIDANYLGLCNVALELRRIGDRLTSISECLKGERAGFPR